MIPELYLGRYDQPESIATKQNVEDASAALGGQISTLQLQVAEIRRIPWQICRTNSTAAQAPSATELGLVTPRQNEVTTVILSNGTREVWQFDTTNGWTLKQTVTPGDGNNPGLGGFAASQDAQHMITFLGTANDGTASSVTMFNDPARIVTVTESVADYLASGCATDCEIVYDLVNDSFHILSGGVFLNHPEPIVRVFIGTISARQFAKRYEANGKTYCSNYHQCYEYADITRQICVHKPLSGTFTVQAELDNGSDYTVLQEATTGTLTFAAPDEALTAKTNTSGTQTTFTLVDFMGAIKIIANPDSDDFFITTSLPLPEISAGCC